MFERTMTIKEPSLTAVASCVEGTPYPTVHMLGHALSGSRTTALVVDGGAGLPEDLQAIQTAGITPGVVIATAKGLGNYPGRIDHVAVLDPRDPGGFAVIRAKDGEVEGNLDFTVHLLCGTADDFARSGADYRWAFNPMPAPGCALSFAAFLGLALQADQVVLAGVDLPDSDIIDGELLTTWRVHSERFFSGRVFLARDEGPLSPFLLLPARDLPQPCVPIKTKASGMAGAKTTTDKR